MRAFLTRRVHILLINQYPPPDAAPTATGTDAVCRALDVAIASVALVVLAPLLAIAVIACGTKDARTATTTDSDHVTQAGAPAPAPLASAPRGAFNAATHAATHR